MVISKEEKTFASSISPLTGYLLLSEPHPECFRNSGFANPPKTLAPRHLDPDELESRAITQALNGNTCLVSRRRIVVVTTHDARYTRCTKECGLIIRLSGDGRCMLEAARRKDYSKQKQLSS